MIVADRPSPSTARRSRPLPRRIALGVVALAAAVGGLSACRSEPSTRRVAIDIIESVEGLTDSERQCMLERLDTYDDGELDRVADGNENVDWDTDDPQITDELQQFSDDLAECRAATPATEVGGSADSEPAGSEPSGSEPA